MSQNIGPVIVDLESTELSLEEKEILQHPLVGGVILFSRNYENIEQLILLCDSIRQTKKSPVLITVDQEGGRVQRFREGFTLLPSMRQIGKLYQREPNHALKLAEKCGWLMAMELLAVGIDLSFAPVLDLDKANVTCIGDRAFHEQPEIVTLLASHLIKGMNEAGMAATGKHFPGHGSVSLDTHHALPLDSRPMNEIEANDLQPFIQLISHLKGMMPAHIIFSSVDEQPVGFSRIWLQNILRDRFQFKGVIFSDDLNMEGANIAGDYHRRAKAALDAGCDMILICNNRQGTVQILDHLTSSIRLTDDKFKTLLGRLIPYSQLKQLKKWQEYHQYVRGKVEHDFIR